MISQTETYLTQVEACVTEIPRLLEAYADRGPYRQTADRIAEAESDCDRTRNDLLAVAFDGATTDSLVYRELALLLDGLVDTMEGVTDQLLLITGNQSWIAIESEHARPT